MKDQALFSSKHKSKKIKCHLLQFLFGTLRVKMKKKSLTLQFLFTNQHQNDFSMFLIIMCFNISRVFVGKL